MKTGVLVSGGGSNLQAIIEACDNGSIDAEIVFTGSDNPEAFGLTRAENKGIPVFVTDYADIIRRYRENPESLDLPSDADMDDIARKQTLFSSDTDPVKVIDFLKTRVTAEAAMINEMARYDFDILVLAGFMRTFTPYFIDRVNTDKTVPRIMNIHPALLPSFPGTDGYGDTFQYGCKTGGCTVHFIDYGEDSGPIIGQKSFQIEPSDTLETVKDKGLALEWQLYPECIQLYAENRLSVDYSTGRGVVTIKP